MKSHNVYFALETFIFLFLSHLLKLSEYFSVTIDLDEEFLKGGSDPVLSVLSAGHALHVFVNNQLSGLFWDLLKISIQLCIKNFFVFDVYCAVCVKHLFVLTAITGTAYGSLENPKLTFTGKVKLWAGNNKISILSIAVGLPVSWLSSLIFSKFNGYVVVLYKISFSF